MDSAALFLVPPSLHVEALLLEEDEVTIHASSEAAGVRCPVCGEPAERVHSRYTRTLGDLPWAGFAVHLQVRVRRFLCANPTCPRTIFAERLAGIAPAFAHRTDRQRERLTDLALALGGEEGSRLAAKHGMPVSVDTLLRLIRGAPERELPTPTVLGVDDWAIHKGLTYGTILVDLERRRPVDLLPDRSSASLAAWLKAHPGVQVIARDRGGAYAEGARDGAPDAIQVADRWHLVDNLADALAVLFRAKGSCLKAAAAALSERAESKDKEEDPVSPWADAVYQGKRRHPQPERWRERAEAAAEAGVAQRREKYDQARALHANGASVAQIPRTVGISRMTVYHYLREGPPQRKRHSVHGQQRVLAPYEPYLLQRWHEGCRMATVLWREIRAQGFAHSVSNVQRFVAELRREGLPPAGRPRTALTKAHGPPPRLVAALVLRRPERRTDEQRAYLKLLAAEEPTIATAIELAEDFLVMLRRREGERLEAWLNTVEASDIDEVKRFAAKLRTDHAAVQAGLTLRHSNGQTEGHVNRLKLVKRQGYGRAKVDLLRKRLLRAA
ncbi:MAG: ISL3 family transposase [Solirubrobacteraceae bacterium]